MSTIEQVLEKFKGIVIRVPSLYSLSPSWHPRVVPDLDGKIEEHVESWRQRWVPEPAAYKQSLGANCNYCVRAISPEANIPSLQIGARYVSWLFAWDDDLDLGTFNGSARQRELIRIEVLRAVQKALLGNTVIEKPSDWRDTPPNLAESFSDIGFSLQDGTELEPLQHFLCDTLCDYITEAVRLEDVSQDGIILDLDVYLEGRMENSGVYPTIAQSLLLQDIALPAWFLKHPIPMKMMRHISIMVALCNDIVSAHKEMGCKRIDNIVPLLVYHQGLEPQEAVYHICQIIHDSYTAFENLVPEVLALASENGLAAGPTFVTGCKDIYIGLANWTYYTKRYHDFQPEEGETEVLITMG
ncbi:isoprenoid synthase domain-containing protein [Penicillium vulpinum]|uniref:Terpene synthase n=1 Tax=Penicillium vulpinum TaxID=29845 RepID=A0A1V6SAK1_9EURO|nr:isoprenoid synthase domain-containing protein [Penicillium vulpinum]KAJ5960537.1 isoprenoid synthase domain-containing protein [Penicillium vulpinum]OQE11057.1 hypothetical protein PENVUL_c003G08263 [Penicillium vulpinum]